MRFFIIRIFAIGLIFFTVSFNIHIDVNHSHWSQFNILSQTWANIDEQSEIVSNTSLDIDFLALESLGLIDKKHEKHLGDELWEGMKRSDLIALIKSLPNSPADKTIYALQKNALLSASAVHFSSSPEPGKDFLTQRLKKLIVMGAHKEAYELYQKIKQPYHERLVEQGILAALFKEQKSLACIEVKILQGRLESKELQAFSAYCDISLSQGFSADNSDTLKKQNNEFLHNLSQNPRYKYIYNQKNPEEFSSLSSLEQAILVSEDRITLNKATKLSLKSLANTPTSHITYLLQSSHIKAENRAFLLIEGHKRGVVFSDALAAFYLSRYEPSSGKEISAPSSSSAQSTKQEANEGNDEDQDTIKAKEKNDHTQKAYKTDKTDKTDKKNKKNSKEEKARFKFDIKSLSLKKVDAHDENAQDNANSDNKNDVINKKQSAANKKTASKTLKIKPKIKPKSHIALAEKSAQAHQEKESQAKKLKEAYAQLPLLFSYYHHVKQASDTKDKYKQWNYLQKALALYPYFGEHALTPFIPYLLSPPKIKIEEQEIEADAKNGLKRQEPNPKTSAKGYSHKNNTPSLSELNIIAKTFFAGDTALPHFWLKQLKNHKIQKNDAQHYNSYLLTHLLMEMLYRDFKQNPPKSDIFTTGFQGQNSLNRTIYKNIIENIDRDKKIVHNPALIYEKGFDIASTVYYKVPQVDVWDRLKTASQNNNKGETILLSATLLRNDPLQGAYPGLLRDIFHSLKTVGLIDISNKLAIKALLENEN